MTSVTQKIKASIYELIDTGSHQNIAKTTKLIAKKFGLRDRLLNYTHVEIRNYLMEPKFKKVPIKERMLLLPHCLRNTKKCQGVYGDEGLKCKRCGACQIDKIMKIAEKKGYKKIFILPGGSMVEKLIKKYKPKAVIGLACFGELSMGMDKMKEFNIPNNSILLLKEGCQNTEASLPEIEEKLSLFENNSNSTGKVR